MGQRLRWHLQQLQQRFPQFVLEIRGKGLLAGIKLPDSIVVRGATGTMEFVRTPTICAEIMAGGQAAFDRALAALETAFPGGRVAGKIVSEGHA